MMKPSNDDKKLCGKNAIVTGASRGIGRAVALRLSRDGASAVLIARSGDQLKALAEQIRCGGSEAIEIECDVSDAEKLREAIDKARTLLGHLDILVNNAGTYKTEAIDGHSLTVWHEIMETNLTSAMVATSSVIGDMKSRGWGRIVNISSISGRVAEAYGAAYSSSKFGMIGLTQAAALESARFGVTVNAVCPGWVATRMAYDQFQDPKWCELLELPPNDAEELSKLSVPQGRLIDPEEVAGLVSFLCSEDARGITGQSINICGGLSLH